MLKELVPRSWARELEPEFRKQYFHRLEARLYREYRLGIVQPTKQDLFRSLRRTPFQSVKVVIFGMEPYSSSQAMGVAYGTRRLEYRPALLRNIFSEVESDFGLAPPSSNLLNWSKQGVLLMNHILSVRKDHPQSHREIGWEQFTDAMIRALGERDYPVVFLLWGEQARSKKKLIPVSKHWVLESSYPSNISSLNGFFGCKHFTKTNTILSKYTTPIDWSV